MHVNSSIILLLFSLSLFAQDTNRTFRKAERMLRIYYQNDFYTQTDHYFTQGEHVDYIHPVFNNFFLKKALINLSHSSFIHSGVSFYGGGYTPVRLDTAGPLPDDRPFAAYMYFGFFREVHSLEKNLRVKSEMALGWTGPPALGKATQVFLHRSLGSSAPLGWDNQVRTDLILQYSLILEKALFSLKKIPLLWVETGFHAGTMRDNIFLGLKSVQDIFEQKRKFFFFPFGRICLTAVAYDALMQGGIFNRKNPHVFRSTDLERLVARGSAGIKAGYKKFRIGFSLEYISPEFKGGLPHRWGNVEIEAGF